MYVCIFFCPVLGFLKCMSNAICDLKHFMNIYRYSSILLLKMVFTIQCSTRSLAGSHCIFLKSDRSIQSLGSKFEEKRICLFWSFLSFFFLIFSSKKETMRTVHKQKQTELVRYRIFLERQKIGTYFVNGRILVCSLFSWGPLRPLLSYLI